MTAESRHWDVLVVGGGHAGCEAALAAARLGARTLLLTINNDHLAQMSCNPAVGGIAKGHVVREIDALGGEMGLNADAATIQFRMLNRSRGPAVRSPRAQCDKVVYQRRMKHVLERQPNLAVHQARAVRFVTAADRIRGVITQFGEEWCAEATVLATGTFLAAKLHYGLDSFPGGRAGDEAAAALAQSIRDDLSLRTSRLKTGTPMRILAGGIDFSAMERQDADDPPGRFSYRDDPGEIPALGGPRLEQRPCYLTQTTPETARVVRENLDRSPLYSGRIDATGARYCPSFEDKVVRFPDRETHHIYLEPEGNFTDEYYVNGISTSLPVDVQWPMVRSLVGLENAHISRYAYAIEYDFVFPHQIDDTLRTRRWHNLFLAGQINGTSGYEEAAGQGLIAGINAARQAAGTDRLTLGRDQAYIGVMVDDLVTKDIVEPYRLFTSRAEYRLLLRQDNADLRLTQLGYELGLVARGQYDRVSRLREEIRRGREALTDQHDEQGTPLWKCLRRQEVSYGDFPGLPRLSPRAAEQLEIEAKYEGYVQRQFSQIEGLKRLQSWPIPDNFDYGIKGMRAEARAKLEQRRPRDLGQASRIDGVTPAEIALLQVHLKRRRDAETPRCSPGAA